MRAGYDRVRQPARARGGSVRQHRRLRHLSTENQHHRHRSSGGPGRRLPQIHQRQPHPVPYERLACCDRPDGRGKGLAPAEPAIDHVRRLALHFPATGDNTPARRFRLRSCRGRRPASRCQQSLPRTIRASPGEPAGRFGKCDHLGVAAWRRLLPPGLHISRRLADGWDVDDNDAFQPPTLDTSRTGLTSPPAWLASSAGASGTSRTGSGMLKRHRFPAGGCYVLCKRQSPDERRGHSVPIKGGIGEPTGHLAAGRG